MAVTDLVVGGELFLWLLGFISVSFIFAHFSNTWNDESNPAGPFV